MRCALQMASLFRAVRSKGGSRAWSLLRIGLARREKLTWGSATGMQTAVVETPVMCASAGAGSVEVEKQSSHPVVIFMPEIDKVNLGVLCAWDSRTTNFQEGTEWSKLRALYGLDSPSVDERIVTVMRSTPSMLTVFSLLGSTLLARILRVSVWEIIELKDHPWFIGVQSTPEYSSPCSCS